MSQLYADDLYGSQTYSQVTSANAAGNGAYDEQMYNENLYNAAVLLLALFETVTSSDAQNKSDTTAIKAEAISLVDSLFKLFNEAPFATEFITPTDVRLMQPGKNLVDLITITDARVASFIKALPETLTISDVRTVILSRSYQDFMVLIDTLTKQVTNKQLPIESLRLNDWLRVVNAPQSDPWSN
jgi:hypothetical protein